MNLNASLIRSYIRANYYITMSTAAVTTARYVVPSPSMGGCVTSE